MLTFFTLSSLSFFSLFRDAAIVYKCCGTLGRDDDLLIQILCQRTKRQLEAADMAYRSLPDNKKHRSLSEKLNAEIGGNYGNFMQYLAMSRPVFNGNYFIIFLLTVI